MIAAISVLSLHSLLSLSSIALHVEEVRGVSTSSTAEILDALARAIEEHTGERVTLDASESSAVGVVLVAGVTKVRLLARRTSGVRIEASIDLPRRSSERASSLRAFAETLFPDLRVRAEPASPADVPRAPPKLHLASWMAIGVAALSSGAAIAFQVKSGNAHDALSNGVHSPMELDALIDDRHNAQLASVAFLIGAASSAVAAVVLEMILD